MLTFTALASHPWAYPALETIHLFGVALLIGNLVLVELRVWGLGSVLAVRPLASLCLRLVGLGALLCVITGLLMFATQPAELLANRAFTLKMLLLVAAATNAVWFHLRGSLDRLDFVARFSALVSLLIWLSVLALGRWIAYV
ncbi:MAG: hypothetical protein ACKO8O_13870 [Betaproteobacteria bacterium]